MANLVNLVRENPNQKLIDYLKGVLEEAEAGEIVGVVMVKLRPDQCFACNRVGNCSDLELAGALSFALYDLIDSNHVGPEKP